jgi:aminomethyltransferase
MGRVHVGGRDAGRLLQWVCTRDLADMTPGMSRYAHVCKADGGILDDVIVSRYEEYYLVVCNASNRDKIVAWLKDHVAGLDVTIEDRTLETAMIAIQGPKAMAEVQRLLHIDLSGLKRYHFRTNVSFTFKYSVFRSGYTGEDGVEVIVPLNLVKLATPALLGMNGGEGGALIRPAGLGARDSLRLEAAMPLYGHELTEDWDSLTAGQAWCVSLDRKDFVGAEAMRRIRAEGLKRQIVGLELAGRRTARQGFKVLHEGKPVGAVTSGGLTPTVGKSIAMALVASGCAAVGTNLAVEISGQPVDATVVKLPFYKRAD